MRQRYSTSKDINKVVCELVRDGWVPVRRKRHFQIVSPSGSVQTVPGSPSDWRTFLNFIKDIEREVTNG